MKRRLLKIGCLLLLGAVLNVAVAWGLAIRTELPNAKTMMLDVPGAMPSVLLPYVPNAWTTDDHDRGLTMGSKDVRVTGLRAAQFGVSKGDRTDGMLGPDYVAHLIQAGWPMLGVRCVGHVDWRVLPKNGGVQPIWKGGFIAPTKWNPRNLETMMFFSKYPRPVPFWPQWPGFAINTLFYAGVMWMLWATPFALRRITRRRRGRCPACNYPIGQSPACTECGSKVTQSHS